MNFTWFDGTQIVHVFPDDEHVHKFQIRVKPADSEGSPTSDRWRPIDHVADAEEWVELVVDFTTWMVGAGIHLPTPKAW